MAALSGDQIAKKWLQAMTGGMASQNYIAGVNATTVAPTQLAAQNLQLYLANVQAAVNSGRMAAKLNAVSLQQWQHGAVNKGAPRLASGAQGASAKMQAVYAKWAPIYQQAKQAAQAIPKTSDAIANLQRAAAAIRVMVAAAGKTSG